MSGRINTVIFDLGNVLVDFHPLDGLRELGFDEECVEVFRKNIFSGLWEECDGYPLSDEEIRKKFKAAVPGYEKEVDQLWDNVSVVTSVYEYSVEWVRSLKERGLKVYILSNFGQQAFKVNSKLYTFLNYVDGKVISYAECITKPSAEIYECLLERYQINPAEAVFIDDRGVNVEGAKAVGIHGIVFTNYDEVSAQLEAMLQQ